MKIVFMGTPAFAVPTLLELVGHGHDVAAVYTQPPRPAGRGMAERRSDVHEAAAALGLTVRHPERLRGEAEAIAVLEPNALVVVAYGQILPQAILDIAPLGAWNLHASLLPRWRGAAPIARAIMAGDGETGVAVMMMEAGLDTGPVAMEERVAILAGDTAGDLAERLSRLGADLMARALGGLARGGLATRPQADAGVTYAAKIAKDEARIDFARPAAAVRAQIHGLSPWPGAWCTFEPGGGPERLKVLRCVVVADDGASRPAEPGADPAAARLAAGADAEEAQAGEPRSDKLKTVAGAELNAEPPASDTPGTILDDRLTVACGAGAVRLTRIQRAGKGEVDAAAFLNGTRLGPGSRLG